MIDERKLLAWIETQSVTVWHYENEDEWPETKDDYVDKDALKEKIKELMK